MLPWPFTLQFKNRLFQQPPLQFCILYCLYFLCCCFLYPVLFLKHSNIKFNKASSLTSQSQPAKNIFKLVLWIHIQLIRTQIFDKYKWKNVLNNIFAQNCNIFLTDSRKSLQISRVIVQLLNFFFLGSFLSSRTRLKTHLPYDETLSKILNRHGILYSMD